MMQFAQMLASRYGSNLKVLIYTPLGFSIKNGQRVAPYAQGAHYNHVHVAYAGGPGNPAFFTSQKDAEDWEKKFLGNGIQSITTNTAELSQLARNAGPSTPVKYDEFMRQFVPNQGAGRPGEVRLKPPMLPQAMGGNEEMVGKGYIPPNSLYRQDSGSAGTAPINITAPITINQQPGQSADELASIVAMKIGEAVADARAASIFV